MPFVSISRPAIGISILKSVLEDRGIPCDLRVRESALRRVRGLRHLQHARRKGQRRPVRWRLAVRTASVRRRARSRRSTSRRSAVNVGPREYDADHGRAGARRTVPAGVPRGVSASPTTTSSGSRRPSSRTSPRSPLARLIKETWPEKVDRVRRAATARGRWDAELHRSFPWIDYVCSGEGEQQLPAPGRGDRGRAATALASPVSSTGGTAARSTTAAARRSPIWTRVPSPDYDDYFAAVSRSRARAGAASVAADRDVAGLLVGSEVALHVLRLERRDDDTSAARARTACWRSSRVLAGAIRRDT